MLRLIRSVLCWTVLLVLGSAVHAAPAPTLNGDYAVCDPYSPQNCLRPNPDGSLSTTGGGGSSGGPTTIADGADATQGAKADAPATDGTSSWSVVALLKGLYNRLGAVVLSTSNAIIGTVRIDQTTPGTTNRVSIGSDGVVATNAFVYPLLVAASATGPVTTPVAGGYYFYNLSGTFGGASVQLQQTLNGVTGNVGAALTAAPSSPVIYQVGQGTTFQAVITGATGTTNLNASLNGTGAPGLFGTVSTVFAGSTGVDYSANAPTIPNVGAAFGASGPYAGFVLVKTIPAGTRNSIDIKNTSGAQIVVMRDDGTASPGTAPVNATVFSLAGGNGAGSQGGSWSSATFRGRLQIYAPSATAQVSASVD